MEETRQTEGAASRRSLGAILITDAAGFSALASRDEARALDQLQADMEIMRSCCARFQGRIIKSTGDGYLMFFDSAVLAVECALDIRTAMTVRPGEGLFQHRIGVHLGDVVLTNDDAYGDGVNVASRLEGAAAPGSVLISQTVFDVIRGKVSCRSTFEGEKAFKGLASRIPVWSVSPGEGVSGGPRRHAPLWAVIATPVLLVVAVTLSINSAQIRDRAAADVAKARAERDQLLDVLARAEGGVPMREMQFDKMKNVVEAVAKPNDPEAKLLVHKLDGLSSWKGWLNKKIDSSSVQKPLQVTVATPEGAKKAAVWKGEGNSVQIKDDKTTKTVRFEELDPSTLTALTESLSGMEPEAQRAKIQTWIKDYHSLYKQRFAQLRSQPNTRVVRRSRPLPPGAKNPDLEGLKQAQDAIKSAGLEVNFDEELDPGQTVPDPPATTSSSGD